MTNEQYLKFNFSSKQSKDSRKHNRQCLALVCIDYCQTIMSHEISILTSILNLYVKPLVECPEEKIRGWSLITSIILEVTLEAQGRGDNEQSEESRPTGQPERLIIPHSGMTEHLETLAGRSRENQRPREEDRWPDHHQGKEVRPPQTSEPGV